MKVTNIHTRIIDQPKEQIAPLLDTLSSRKDMVWPIGKWPAMRLKQGLQEGSSGGHGPIRYTVSRYLPGEIVQFEFSKPTGFNGFHRFELSSLEEGQTQLKHIIKMNTRGMGTLAWVLAIRWLHDALVEDAFDRVENYFSGKKKKTEWSFWVKTLRSLLK